MSNVFLTPEFETAESEERVLFIPSAQYKLPTHRECMDVLLDQNDIVHRYDPEKDNEPRVFVATSAHVTSWAANIIRDWKYADYCQLAEGMNYTAHLYYGDDTTATLGVHEDYVDVLYWQLVGSVEWRVPKGGVRSDYEDRLYQFDSYTLRPGDMIYVPKAFRHSVNSLGERFGVSFGRDHHSYKTWVPPAVREKLELKRRERRMKEMLRRLGK